MKREEFQKKSFDEVMSTLASENEPVTTIEGLRDFAAKMMQEGAYRLAKYVVDAISEGNNADIRWWLYDFGKGTLDRPQPIRSKEEVAYLVETI